MNGRVCINHLSDKVSLGWAPKNWCFWTVVLQKTLASPLDCKEIQPVHSEGDQPWDFFGGNDAEAETPVLWPPHAKSWLTGKDSDAGKNWGQEEKGMPEDEMAGWHHWLDGRESEWTLGVCDGQGGLACCDSRGRKESDTTERLNWTESWVCLSDAQQSQSTDTGVWWRKVQRLLQGDSQGEKTSTAQKTWTPDGFWGRVFQDNCRDERDGVCDQLLYILLIGWWTGRLACCDSWGRKESDMTERLIWSNLR